MIYMSKSLLLFEFKKDLFYSIANTFAYCANNPVLYQYALKNRLSKHIRKKPLYKFFSIEYYLSICETIFVISLKLFHILLYICYIICVTK